MNGWKKAALISGALAALDFLGITVATLVAITFAASQYMTPLEDRLVSGAGVLMIALTVAAAVLYAVGEFRGDRR